MEISAQNITYLSRLSLNIFVISVKSKMNFACRAAPEFAWHGFHIIHENPLFIQLKLVVA